MNKIGRLRVLILNEWEDHMGKSEFLELSRNLIAAPFPVVMGLISLTGYKLINPWMVGISIYTSDVVLLYMSSWICGDECMWRFTNAKHKRQSSHSITGTRYYDYSHRLCCQVYTAYLSLHTNRRHPTRHENAGFTPVSHHDREQCPE